MTNEDSSNEGIDHEDPQEDIGDSEEEEDVSLDEKEKNEDDDDESPMVNDASGEKKRKIHKLSMKTTEDFNEKLKQRGVIYVARIPPRMTPTKLKTILSDFGEVTRVFCQEEDAAARKRRRKLSGNGSKRYTEGWVEYASKKVAKHVAAALHQQSISNYKRSPHYGDLWNLKYLPKFQWSHLTEKVAYERRVREQKLRLETMQAKRETASYKKLLETGKMLDKIEERKRKREQKDGGAAGNSAEPNKPVQKNTFQVKPMDDGANRAAKKALLGSLV
jgi:ESF2/ABP1 family protein